VMDARRKIRVQIMRKMDIVLRGLKDMKEIRAAVKKYIYYDEDNTLLLHGDCFEILRLLPKGYVSLVLTDPPYNLEAVGGGFYGVKWHGKEHEPRQYLSKLKEMQCDRFDPAKFLPLLPTKNGVFFCNKFLVKPYLDFAYQEKLLFDIHILWKRNPIPAKQNHFLHDVEYIICLREPSSYFNTNAQFDLYRKVSVTTCKSNNLHPAQKPVEVFEKYLHVLTKKNDVVLDPFLGSGTAAVACKNLGRKCVGIEIKEEYLEVAVCRLRQETLL